MTPLCPGPPLTLPSHSPCTSTRQSRAGGFPLPGSQQEPGPMATHQPHWRKEKGLGGWGTQSWEAGRPLSSWVCRVWKGISWPGVVPQQKSCQEQAPWAPNNSCLPLLQPCVRGRDGDKGGEGEMRLWQTIQPQGNGEIRAPSPGFVDVYRSCLQVLSCLSNPILDIFNHINQTKWWSEEFIESGVGTKRWGHPYLSSTYLLSSNLPFISSISFSSRYVVILQFFACIKILPDRDFTTVFMLSLQLIIFLSINSRVKKNTILKELKSNTYKMAIQNLLLLLLAQPTGSTTLLSQYNIVT